MPWQFRILLLLLLFIKFNVYIGYDSPILKSAMQTYNTFYNSRPFDSSVAPSLSKALGPVWQPNNPIISINYLVIIWT
jgi:hypothetical protein